MSKIVYTLSNSRNQDIGLGSVGILPSNQQRAFTVEEDSPDETFLGQVISQGLVSLVSAVPAQSAYGPANLTTSQVTQIQALVSTQGNFAGGNAVWRTGVAPAAGSGQTTDFTMCQAWRLPFDCAGFRIGFENVNTTQLPAITLAKYAICGAAGNTGTQALDAVANYHTSSPAAITFDGNAGYTPGLRFGASRPSAIQWSDWIPLSGADEGKTLVVRLLVPAGASWTYAYFALSFSSFATYLAQVTNPMASNVQTLDYVTTNVSWALNSGNMNGNLLVPYLELMPKTATVSVLNVAHFGDSVTTGTCASGDPSVQPTELACQALSTSTVKLIPMPRGYGGRKTEEVYALLRRYLDDTKVKPNIVIWQVASQNNGTSAAAYQATQGYINEVRRLCRQIGAVLILQTAVPINGTSTSVDNARKAINAAALATGEIVCDSDATLTDGGSPAAYQAAYGAGGHPTIAWYTADVAASFVPAIRRAAALFGVTV
jgi:hypothetical protein